MAVYGVNSGGTNQITFYSTPENQNNPLIQQMQADMAKIVPVIEILRNQGPDRSMAEAPLSCRRCRRSAWAERHRPL